MMINSALTAASFQSPPTFIKLQVQLRPQKRRLQHQQHLLIVGNNGAITIGKQEFVLKPVQATLGPNSTGGGGGSPLPDVIQQFYSSLNEKDSKRLENLIAPDCIIDDNAYYKLLDIKSTQTYFRRLMDAMGKNFKFAIDEVSQGVEPTFAVMWHLEWNGKTIPFTKGCSFYICSRKEAALVIRKIHIFQESPVKPCKFSLEILNIATNLFDTFPNIAEGLLNNPEQAIQPFVRLYKSFVKPFIVPFLAYYTHFWTYLAKVLTMMLHLLYRIIKCQTRKGTVWGLPMDQKFSDDVMSLPEVYLVHSPA
uniref:SnoaL-like domain-containing protein n=1 Tax=Oryza barthii TaxID=65489 RepID=A0A0D3FRQ5_9ORYZ